MSYFSDHYPLYVPPYITGTEKVRITITKPTPTQEMEQRIRMRFAFAMSSFGRMFKPSGISREMRSLCDEWSKIEEQPPQGDLYLVDRYFLELWKKYTS
ncbi:hypothetical protein Syn7803C72_19 [Synechococcus phage ACG-2014d]|jgi:hypothetical protein|uniref:Uncharacterized protein n=2 Tax=Synechococcus phage ACG-2014d TaxID=1493509 RepID=A0A0E3G0G2_9CAUD|nr:hypothetical protein AAJ59_gp019 [Synechococcus phage ACG-2014d]YP_010355188.1 hypothetical protein M1M12_gp019 [Synechococcus phage ACG-2014d]AIX14630.1 hypothetical protein Syn7803C45_19 [Synechococcus phage ACG-2014d]AIX14850.1 hypothetical protein Syn7803C46_19 [Synechococcus phage ACG-2014d]AIX15277.1 hypothetical protein Syn7803C48_19 [Synechococcus phage ACG-2014d]AIX15495.1 hypothetical protein Syn7803C49_19 [Synechococcus phage ACG-2014d]AIX15924.1 hypothetical protein Syn7803C54_